MIEREVSAAKEASIVTVSTPEPIVVFDATISLSEAERRRKISERWQDPIYRARMSASRRIIWQDPEFKARMHESRLGRTSPMKGRHHTPEARAKMSESRRGKKRGPGRPMSPERRQRQSETMRKLWQDPQFKEKMKNRKRGEMSNEQRDLLSRMFKGREVKPETRKKISEAKKGKPNPMKGKHHTLESRQRMSEGVKKVWDRPGYRERMIEVGQHNMTPEKIENLRKVNKGRKLTPEHKRKVGEASRGRKQSPEWIAKRVAKTKGRKASSETRRKISEARKRNWQDPEYRRRMEKSSRSPRKLRAARRNIKKAIEAWRATGKLSPQAIQTLREKAIKRWKEDPGYRRRVSEGISASKADKAIESSLWNLVRRGLMRRIVKEGYLTKAELEELRIFFEVKKGQGRPPEALIEKMSIGIANLVE